MTEQEQRIAIAEACGFQRWKGDKTVWLCKPRDEKQRKYWLNSGSRVVDEPVDELRCVPDYCNDLNAIHGAMRLGIPREAGSRWRFYARNLFRVVHGNELETPTCHLENHLAFDLINATAAQRAEAFLRTIGKWKDTQ